MRASSWWTCLVLKSSASSRPRWGCTTAGAARDGSAGKAGCASWRCRRCFPGAPPCVPACAPAWVHAYTRSIGYDPEGAYVASTNGDGCLNVWEIEGGKQVLGRKKACPKVRPALARGLCAEQRLALGLGAAVRRGSEAGRAAGAGPGWHAPCLQHIPAARPVGRPQADLASTARCQPAWHPDGGALLAAPGTDSDIVCYERMSW